MSIFLKTARLYLRPYQVSDFEQLYPILSDPTTMSFWPQPYNQEQVHHWISRAMESYEENGFGRWPIFLQDNDQLIGCAGYFRLEVNDQFENDLGYIIHHPFWRMGYASEVAKACLDYGLHTLKLDRIVANMPTDHLGSKAVAEKIGLKETLTFINKKNRNIPTYLFVND